MSALAKEKDFTHVKLPPGHPQADPVERVNKTYKSMIMTYITPDHRTWGDDLDEKTWCYNTNIHETIGYSPFYLCNGRILVRTPTLKRKCERKAAEEEKK